MSLKKEEDFKSLLKLSLSFQHNFPKTLLHILNILMLNVNENIYLFLPLIFQKEGTQHYFAIESTFSFILN